MMTVLEPCAAGLGRRATLVAATSSAIGLLAFASGLALGRAPSAFAALAAAWLFAAGIAAGGLALSAAIRLGHARWAGSVLPIAEATEGFFRPALALLLVLVLGVRTFAPWPAAEADDGRLYWLGARLLIASAALFVVGIHYLRKVRRKEPEGPAAVGYLLLYAVVLSVWACDLVLGFAEGPASTVIPPLYFVGAFVSAIAWVTLVVAARGGHGPAIRHDLGKLLFAFIVLWTYLLWAAFLPTWYGNIPEEACQLLARWRGPWKLVTIGVLVTVFVWPFWLLFWGKLKRARGTLGTGATLVLLGMLGERCLLVFPSLKLPSDAVSIAIGVGVAVGVVGLFVLSVGGRSGLREMAAAAAGAPSAEAQVRAV